MRWIRGFLVIVMGLSAGFAFGDALMVVPGPPATHASTPSQFPKNSLGQTYGSALGLARLEDSPDLVLVEADSGVEGYVRKVELLEFDGGVASNPREVRRRGTAAANADVALSVYSSDGRTVVGKWHPNG
jgi:hypothetical protein